MTVRPRAYFLTWTTHGSWIHGDERGSWQAIRGQRRADFLPKSPDKHPSPRGLILQPAARTTAESAIQQVCELRNWLLSALQVRSNHAHVVVHTADTPPETAMQQLKAWSTRAIRNAGFVGSDESVWTRHGSTRYLWDDDAVRRAAIYVRDWQDGQRWV